ncbi:MAG TPA: 6-carboxytetrahydropterin synthase [Thermoanaerobaculia bacterium]|nr:6-carboxytetrahydropterin synthase [Thermoanaerobaculia bacterium]
MPSYLLRVTARFEAAHHLTSYKGAPEPVHGHSWRVEAALGTAELDAEGMAYDFVEVQAALRELAARIDHRDLNTVPPFDRTSPTTERIAAWFFTALAERLPAAPLMEVTVWEGPDCSATYRPA